MANQASAADETCRGETSSRCAYLCIRATPCETLIGSLAAAQRKARLGRCTLFERVKELATARFPDRLQQIANHRDGCRARLDHRHGILERDAADRHGRQPMLAAAAVDAQRRPRGRPRRSQCPSCRCRTPARWPGTKSVPAPPAPIARGRVRGQAENRRGPMTARASAGDRSFWPTWRPSAPAIAAMSARSLMISDGAGGGVRLRDLDWRDRERRRSPCPCSAAAASARRPRGTRAPRRTARGPRPRTRRHRRSRKAAPPDRGRAMA